MVKGKYLRTKEHREMLSKIHKGRKHTEEAKIKISLSIRGRKLSEDHRKKISLALSGKPRKPLTEEHKHKIGQAHLGHPCYHRWNPMPQEVKNRLSSLMKGRKFSRETILRMRKAQRGEKHPNWKGGKYSIEYPLEFGQSLRKEIRLRDGMTCKQCGIEDTRLEVHHIDHNRQNNQQENLITLCVRCHRSNHAMVRKQLIPQQEILKGGLKK